MAHLLSCVPCATAHPRARARAPGRAKTKASGQKGSKNVKRTEEAYGTGANLLASAFNLIVDTLPHKVKGYYEP